jgi:hypothetical protein
MGKATRTAERILLGSAGLALVSGLGKVLVAQIRRSASVPIPRDLHSMTSLKRS